MSEQNTETMTTVANQLQIGDWLDRHDIRLHEMTEAAATKVAAEYHAAMAADWDEAHREDRARRCDNWGWHSSAPSRMHNTCPECPSM